MHCMGGALAGILYSRLPCVLMETKVLTYLVANIWSWRRLVQYHSRVENGKGDRKGER